jgi:hypothetical protein
VPPLPIFTTPSPPYLFLSFFEKSSCSFATFKKFLFYGAVDTSVGVTFITITIEIDTHRTYMHCTMKGFHFQALM